MPRDRHLLFQRKAAIEVAGMTGRYPDSYLDRCDDWRAAAILD
jgi:hypothetical protein